MEDRRKNALDELFKRKLNEEQLEPDNQLWNEIEQELQKNEKPNRRILFILIGILLLAGVTGWYFVGGNKISSNGNTVTENVKPISAQTESNTVVSTKNETASDDNSNSVSSTNNSSTVTADNSVSSSNEKVDSKNNSQSSASVNQNKTAGTNTTITTTTSTKKKKENDLKTTSLSINKTENSITKNADSKKETPQQLSESVVSNNNSAVENKTDLNPVISGNTTTENSLATDSISENKNPDSENTPTENSITEKTDSSSTSTTVTPPITDPTTLKTKQPIKWYAEAGTSYLSHSSKIKSDSAYYLSRRADEESSVSNFNYAFHFGAIINHLQLQSGIGIYKPGEKTNYNNIGTCLSLKSTGYYLPDSVTFIYQYDSTYHISRNDSLIKQNGTHTNSYLTIPLEVYYHFPMNKISVQVGGGMSGAFPLKWNSVYINQQVTQLENPSELKMLSPVVFNLNLNLGIAIPVYKNLAVVLDAEYRKNLNSVFKKTYSVNQKYQSVGAGVSVRYSFGKK